MTQQQPSNRLVWIDMEMSGLDVERERVLEVAVVITDVGLRIIAEGPNLVLHQPASVLEAMDDWNRQHHGASGLVQRVQQSTHTEASADQQLLRFVQEHCAPRTAPLAGNSVHQDWLFLKRFMPALEDYLHYRHVDVSTVKELVRYWCPTVFAAKPHKKSAHRALDDIYESIDELRYYRDQAFQCSVGAAVVAGGAPSSTK